MPEIAETKTNVVIVLEAGNLSETLPPADYAFLEMFCRKPSCDCRCVFFSVVSSRIQKPMAVIACGWGSVKFYQNWFKQGADKDIAMLRGP